MGPEWLVSGPQEAGVLLVLSETPLLPGMARTQHKASGSDPGGACPEGLTWDFSAVPPDSAEGMDWLREVVATCLQVLPLDLKPYSLG